MKLERFSRKLYSVVLIGLILLDSLFIPIALLLQLHVMYISPILGILSSIITTITFMILASSVISNFKGLKESINEQYFLATISLLYIVYIVSRQITILFITRTCSDNIIGLLVGGLSFVLSFVTIGIITYYYSTIYNYIQDRILNYKEGIYD